MPERQEAVLRVLLDQGTPIALRQFLSTHNVSTAYEQGWSSLTNGDLIQKAEKEFDVFITTDKNLYHQQNMTGLRLAVLVLPFANWPKLKNYLAVIEKAVNNLKAGDYTELTLD